MRCTLLLLLVVALGCPKSEAPTEPAESPEPAAEPAAAEEPPKATPPEATPLAPVKLKLLSPGKKPRALLQRGLEADTEEEIEMLTEGSVSMKGGGWDADYKPRSLMQIIDVKTEAVSEDGTADVVLVVRSAEEVEESSEAPNAKMLNTAGVAGSMTVDAAGTMTALEMASPPTVKPGTGPLKAPAKSQGLDMVKDYFRWLTPSLPGKPVGVGAKWRVTRTLSEYDTEMKEVTIVELVERTDDKAVLRFTVKSTGDKHLDFEKVDQDIKLLGEAEGTVTLTSGHFAPETAEFSHSLQQLVTMEGKTDAKDKLTSTTSRTVKVNRK